MNILFMLWAIIYGPNGEPHIQTYGHYNKEWCLSERRELQQQYPAVHFICTQASDI